MHVQPRQRIERTKRFVKQQHAGASRKCTSERGALRHSTRNLAGALVRRVCETHEFEELGDASLARRALGAAGEPDRNVLRDGAPR